VSDEAGAKSLPTVEASSEEVTKGTPTTNPVESQVESTTVAGKVEEKPKAPAETDVKMEEDVAKQPETSVVSDAIPPSEISKKSDSSKEEPTTDKVEETKGERPALRGTSSPVVTGS
jgi:hypothetical protein